MAYNNRGDNYKNVGAILEKLVRPLDAINSYDMAIALN